MSASEARLSALLQRWEELHEQGRPVTVEELCHDAPELAEELQRRIDSRFATRAIDAPDQPTGAPLGTLATSASRPANGAWADEQPTGQLTNPPSFHSLAASPDLPTDFNWDTAHPEAAARVEVPGYEIIKELGRGGMGVVYLARQEGLDRLVALKMVLSGGHASAQEAQRFRAEAQAISRLQHPNLVQVYEVGEHDGRPFFSLEYVDGGTLQGKLRRTPQPADESARLVEILARAMHCVHGHGIIHRDLKPANVLLMSDGTPKITDFGLAKKLDAGEGQTRTGAIMGTPAYMAPEQASGRIRDIGPHTDVYALGAMLYESLTGRAPFLAATDWETILEVVERDPVPPSSLQPKVPRDLETICLKCLHKEPRKRYASADELADDLHRFLNDEPIKARPVRSWERAWKWAKRRPAVAALLVVSVLALLTVAAYEDQIWRQEAAEQRRRGDSRNEIRLLLSRANQAIDGNAWKEAQALLHSAGDRLRSESNVDDLQHEVDGMQARVEGRLAALDTLQKFQTARDEALFLATLSAGDPSPAKVKLTIDRTRQALALVGVTGETGSAPALGPEYRENEKTVITSQCYELLLVLAEALAQPLPDRNAEQQQKQARQALAVLDQAARLGLRTRAWHLRRARYLEQAGDGAAARTERKRAERLPAVSALDHYLVGVELYSQQSSTEEIIRAFEEVLRLEPDHFWARYFLSVCYVRLDQPALAKAHLTACLAQRSDVIWVYLMRGFAEGQLREYAAAEADFRAALDRKPDEEARYVLYNNRGVMRIGQKKFAEGIEDLQRAVQLRPRQYQAYASLAEAFRVQSKLAEAQAALDKAIEVAKAQVKTNDVVPETLALLYRNRARLSAQRKDLEAALQDFQHALDVEPAGSPARARTHGDRGRLLHLLKRDTEALTEYAAALKSQPNAADIYRWQAESLLRLKRDEEALQALNRYEEVGGPPAAQVYRERALCWARLGKHASAVADFARAIELEPDDAATRLYRGQEYLAWDFPRRALHDFSEAVRLKPDNLEALSGRGLARARLGQHTEAAADAEEIARRKPADPQLLCTAARILAEAARQLAASPSADRPALEAQARYQDRSLALLRLALDQLPRGEQAAFWQQHVRPDAVFDTLRRTQEYLRLDRAFPGVPRPERTPK